MRTNMCEMSRKLIKGNTRQRIYQTDEISEVLAVGEPSRWWAFREIDSIRKEIRLRHSDEVVVVPIITERVSEDEIARDLGSCKCPVSEARNGKEREQKQFPGWILCKRHRVFGNKSDSGFRAFVLGFLWWTPSMWSTIRTSIRMLLGSIGLTWLLNYNRLG